MDTTLIANASLVDQEYTYTFAAVTIGYDFTMYS